MRLPVVRQQRVRCMLVLHALWLSTLALLTASSILGRQRSHQQLADQLLRGGASSGGNATAAAGPPGFASTQECGEALQLPQVALLFLVKGPIHHEAFWRLWFQQAAGLLPVEALLPALCGDDRAEQRQRVLRACAARGTGTGQAAPAPEAWPPASGLAANEQQQQAPAADGPSASDAAALPRRLLERPGAAAASNRSFSSAAPVRARAHAMRPASRVLDQQALFDVYVHPHPSFQGYPQDSVFRGRELPRIQRVLTEWGQHSLVDAARALLRAAHRNPRNTKFVLLSESDLPLYSPQLLYTQLIGEPLSRLNACNTTRGWDLFEHRWVSRMEGATLKAHHWRKSWQWFVLRRDHAELVLWDRAVDASFRAHCRTMFELGRGEERECYSDEHYIPTLLAVHGLDHETDCSGWLMDTDWARVSKASAHPWEYSADEVNDRLLHRLRHSELRGCRHAAQAAAAARDDFASAADLAAAAGAAAGSAQGHAALAGACVLLEAQARQRRQRRQPLGPRCRLLARKFRGHTAAAALAAAAPCDSGALVLNSGVCPGETPRHAAARLAWQRAAPLVLLALGCLLLPALAALCLGAVAPRGTVPSRRASH